MVAGCRLLTWQRWQSIGALATSMRSLVDPCGLWHDVQSILPSRSGMWPDFWTFIASCLWQLTHVSTALAVFSCAFADFGLCMLWQLTHETLRASCRLPC